jgi:hypothetical protein
MAKKQLRLFRHYRASESIALVSTKIMAISPTTTNKLLEVIASIKLFVLRREIVEDFRSSVHTSWAEAQFSLVNAHVFID